MSIAIGSTNNMPALWDAWIPEYKYELRLTTQLQFPL